MKILGHEYNEYVVGYVISTDKGDVSAQFEKIFSNHPEPAFTLQLGCEGDTTADNLSFEELDMIREYIRSCEEMRETEIAFTKAHYNGSDFKDLTSPIYWATIFEKADWEGVE